MNEVQRIFQVMTYDIDFAGVLNNGVYIRWLEDLRNIFAENVLPINEASTRGIVPALARTEIVTLRRCGSPTNWRVAWDCWSMVGRDLSCGPNLGVKRLGWSRHARDRLGCSSTAIPFAPRLCQRSSGH